MSCKRKFGRLVLISYSDVTNVLVFKPDCDRSGHEVRLVLKVILFGFTTWEQLMAQVKLNLRARVFRKGFVLQKAADMACSASILFK